jgi:putative transposase
MDENNFSLTPGSQVSFQGEKYLIKLLLSLDTLMIEKISDHSQKHAKVSELSPIHYGEEQSQSITKQNRTELVSSEDWEIAKYRESIIKPLSKLSTCSLSLAEDAGKQLGLSWRQIYKLLQRYRSSGNKIASLLPNKSSGGKNKSRLNKIVESIIKATIEEYYLNTQKNKISFVVEEVRRRCYTNNLKAPADMTIRSRINCLIQKNVISKRQGRQSAKEQFSPIIGAFPETPYPLAVLQIDHTPVDLIIVDEYHRKPIGRPYLTIAIDVFSRCITGFCLSLESPSAVSVGLCLTHSIFDKDHWLTERNITGSWPIWGKPDSVHVDNAQEFHSEALQRGCDVHGIKIEYRPLGQPQFGGIVERVIGTMMQLVHQLPGTTFSNVAEKGDYPSEQKAALTLTELERWLTIAITEYYHQKIHSGLSMPPIEKYKCGILGDEAHKGRGSLPRIHNKSTFLIDFLPIERRTLQRHGFMLDHISYYTNSLSPLIADRKNLGKFIIRRDPRDISRIYVLDPNSQEYLEVPYRTLSRPTITLWEHRQALKFLRAKGLEQTDETLIFQAIEKMRLITKEAISKRKLARRNYERTKMTNKNIINKINNPKQTNLIDESDNDKPIKIFENIELW